jgi:hypothetical protein
MDQHPTTIVISLELRFHSLICLYFRPQISHGACLDVGRWLSAV